MAATDEEGVCGLARVFFNAATKASDDSEDILPQEVILLHAPHCCTLCALRVSHSYARGVQDGEDMKLSVFCVFAGLFPEAVGENGAGGDIRRLPVVGLLTCVPHAHCLGGPACKREGICIFGGCRHWGHVSFVIFYILL
jgi:hypothetical protein